MKFVDSLLDFEKHVENKLCAKMMAFYNNKIRKMRNCIHAYKSNLKMDLSSPGRLISVTLERRKH